MERPLVLLVGFRAGVLRAAERLGVDLAVVDRRAPSAALRPRLTAWREVDWSVEPDALLDAARDAVAQRSPVAVLALTEGAVLPAARLRAAFAAPGSDIATAERCSNKIAMKRAVAAAGVPCADFEEVHPETDADGLIARLGLPVVLKRAESSGSRGLVVARSASEVREGLTGRDLAERFVDGVEMSVEGFFRGGERLFTSTTRYLVPLHANVVPSGVDEATRVAAGDMLDRAVAALGLRLGVAHLELFLTDRGPVFGELGARPPGGRLMRLIRRAWGFDPYEAILRIALGREVVFPASPRCAAATWILHPGPGRLRAVEGVERARTMPGVRALEVRVGAGDVVPEREGSGQDVGYLDVVAPTPEEAARRVRAARDALRFVGTD